MVKESRGPRLPATDLGPYRLEAFLGKGGMGTVFVARDERLGRRVAVKRIPAEALEDSTRFRRYRREAKILASLSHPAIVQIFDVVENAEGNWIVMELVDGPTVAELVAGGPLDVRRVLDVGRQTAAGLAEAHAQGVLHRDLKTENVVLQPASRASAGRIASGRVKILDFGLAKVSRGADGDASLTESGQVLGTCRAMSPEQARGLPLDARSDLFALGVLLYEMATGKRPFQAASAAEVLMQITSRPHVPARTLRPEIPQRLSMLIDWLLEKSPELRPADARQVEAALADLEKSLEEGTADAESPAAPDHATTMDYEPADPTAASAGAGSADWRPPRRGLRPAWLALLPVAVLAAVLGWGVWKKRPVPEAPPARPASAVAEPDDYALFQQGMAYLERFDKPGHLEKAVAAFESVLARDAGSAPAHAGLALAYWRQYVADRDPLRLEQALPVAERAARLDEHLALARVALGTVYAESGRHDEAVRELEAALLLAPTNADAYRGLGRVHERRGEIPEAVTAYENAVEHRPTDRFLRDELGTLYYRSGRYDEAEAQFLKSVELAPDGIYGYRNLSAVYFMQGRLPEAAETLQKALAIKPEHSLYSNLGTIFFAQGLYQPSAQAFEKALDHGGANYYLYWANLADAYRLADGHDEPARDAYRQAIRLLRPELEKQPDNRNLVSRLALYLAKGGDRDEALAVLEAADLAAGQAGDHYRAAVAYEVCGERAAALAELAAALRTGFSAREVGNDPELFALRSDPRYHRILAEIGEG